MPSEAELAQMLAPIALYPDSLLTHILIASTYPLELVQAQRWSKQYGELDTENKMKLAEEQTWDPSVIALVAFPSVLEKLNDDLEWTQNLGDAFLQDEEVVLNAVQTLRQEADKAKSFDGMDNMTVTRVEKKIIIEPAQPEVIYVPYYDPRVVYGTWRWHAYPPVYWYTRPVLYGYHRPIYWGPRVHIGFNFFFGAVNWSSHRIVVINHRHSHYYKPARKIAYSNGAQRWKHKPTHRHGVAYRYSKVSKRYDTPQRYQHHQKTRDIVNKAPNQKPNYSKDKGIKDKLQHNTRDLNRRDLDKNHVIAKDKAINNNRMNVHKTEQQRVNKALQQTSRDRPTSTTKPVVQRDKQLTRETVKRNKQIKNYDRAAKTPTVNDRSAPQRPSNVNQVKNNLNQSYTNRSQVQRPTNTHVNRAEPVNKNVQINRSAKPSRMSTASHQVRQSSNTSHTSRSASSRGHQ
ncbi:DUF3300 domain-containing protein [Shewanella aestuarii]|uniref:DUF3300 domain-containing protein n=2 Tax=Shewanella aestuarii TaxID=1028752 RepID=A0A6G9QPW9_9GAMM|nr:DUF3300 domain-containing protein [Shewanella aestuarii]